MALTKIDDRGLKTPIDLQDNEKIRVGTGNDLELFHDGSHSIIEETGTGALKLVTNSSFQVRNDDKDTGEYIINANVNGSVELYDNGSKKFHTHSTGVTVTGYLHIEDGSTGIGLGNSDDLKLFHDGSNSYITHDGTGNLIVKASGTNEDVYIQAARDIYLQPKTNEEGIKVIGNGAVELYHDNVKKCETHADGLHIGDGGNLDMPHDSSKIVWGASDDLQIIHDGTHSRVSAFNTGNLLLKSQNDTKIEFGDEGGATELALHAIRNGAVELYHNNFKKLYTDTNGVIITSGTPSITVYADTDGENATLSLVGKTASGGVGQAGIARIVGSSTATANGSSSMYLQTRASNNSITTALTLDSSQNATFAGTVSDSKGDLRKIIQNTQGSSFTLVAADAGKHILASGDITVPNSVFSAGDAVTIVNNTGGDLTLYMNITTRYKSADGSSGGNFTLATRGMATLLFASGTVCYGSGAGLS